MTEKDKIEYCLGLNIPLDNILKLCADESPYVVYAAAAALRDFSKAEIVQIEIEREKMKNNKVQNKNQNKHEI